VEKYCRAGQATNDNIIWRMRIALWISKAKNITSEYVTITAFPLHHRLHESASMLRYACIACLVYYYCAVRTATGKIAEITYEKKRKIQITAIQK
jgi:hypothetical protein